jgi:hypothetical protein
MAAAKWFFGLMALHAAFAAPAAAQDRDWRAAARASAEKGEVTPIDRATTGRDEAEQQGPFAGATKIARDAAIASLKSRAETVDGPVLAPRAFLASAEKTLGRFVALPNSYSLRAILDDRTAAYADGSCEIADDAPAQNAAADNGPASKRLARLGADYEIRRTEYGVELVFSKFSCVYSLTASCLRGKNDGADCMDDAKFAAIADDMALVNAPD